MSVDLNADVGEGAGQDSLLMPHITSASIACGGHAGDGASMRETVQLASAHGVAVGAHPSFPDREGFGRRDLHLSPREIEEATVAQVAALVTIAAAHGVRLQHVKPHGALFNLAARDHAVADAIARAVVAVDARLLLFGLPNSELLAAGARAGLHTVSEVFADRAYRADGSLQPRDEPGAVIPDATEVVRRVVEMAREHVVRAVDGVRVPIAVDTICVHGDTPGAADLARRIRGALAQGGIDVRAIGARPDPGATSRPPP